MQIISTVLEMIDGSRVNARLFCENELEGVDCAEGMTPHLTTGDHDDGIIIDPRCGCNSVDRLLRSAAEFQGDDGFSSMVMILNTSPGLYADYSTSRSAACRGDDATATPGCGASAQNEALLSDNSVERLDMWQVADGTNITQLYLSDIFGHRVWQYISNINGSTTRVTDAMICDGTVDVAMTCEITTDSIDYHTVAMMDTAGGDIVNG